MLKGRKPVKNRKRITALLLSILLCVIGCGNEKQPTQTGASEPQTAAASETPTGEPQTVPAPTAEKNGEIYILYTSDIHCGVDQGFGFAGLEQVRDTLEAGGYETILVDNGDAIQGELVGTLSKGEAVLELMNDLKYDVAIPGNHEFDYGMDRFLELAGKADFPYISCNFNHQGEQVFPPYVILEAAGKKIAFVGVTTPKTIISGVVRRVGR